MRLTDLLKISLLGFALAFPTAVFAEGDDSSDDSDSNNTASNCTAPKVWDKKQKKCVKKKASLDQDSLYEAGRDLAYAKRYREAIAVLAQAPDQKDKRVLTMLGYANRKSGKMIIGINYYKIAIAIDPSYKLVREYYGEALLQKNDVQGAMVQLAHLQRICGSKSCEPYTHLAKSIKAYNSSDTINQSSHGNY